MYDILQINGVDYDSSPLLLKSCQFPMTNWTKYCPKDDVIENLRIVRGCWRPGAKAPVITGSSFTVDMAPYAADKCVPAKVKANIQTCEFLAPKMADFYFGDDLIIDDICHDFCEKHAILPAALTNNLWASTGAFNAGNPFAEDFARMTLAVISAALNDQVMKSALTGDDANMMAFDGLYTQLENGWQQGNPACPDYLNTEVEVDWAALTGKTPTALVGDRTIAGQTVNVWGSTLSVPEGLNLAQFLEEFWIPLVEDTWLDCRGATTMWEAHVRKGQALCLLKQAACMQLCPNNCGFDPMKEDRAKTAINTRYATLQPSGLSFPMMESMAMPANSMRFGPRDINNVPTYLLFGQGSNNGRYESRLGRFTGGFFPSMQDKSDPLITQCQNMLDDAEGSLLEWWAQKRTQRCLSVSVEGKFGMLVNARHLWLHLKNIACNTPIVCP